MLRQKLHRFMLFGLFVSLLAACSSGKIVRTYEGATLADAQQAVLFAPENISLVSVNGRELPDYLLSSLETKYGLKPGINKVVFKYESVWAVRKRGGEDAPKSQKVESGTQMIEFVASAGETYTFNVQEISSLSEAKRYAESFSVDVLNSANATVASSELFRETNAGVASNNLVFEKLPILKQVVDQVSGGNAVAVAPENTQPQKKLAALDGLKLIWGTATEEEKKAFLVWAFQE